MNADEVRMLARKQPFEPFEIVTADGRQLSVNHPDYVAVQPGRGRIVVVFNRDESFELVDLRQIVSLRSRGEVPQPPPKSFLGGDQDED